MRDILFWISIIGGIVLSIYVGGWLLFIKPIVALCAAYDVGTLTGSIIGWTIFECLVLAPIVADVIIKVVSAIAKYILK